MITLGLLSIGTTVGIFLILSIWLIISERFFVRYGNCKISINDGSVVLEEEGGMSLLTALYGNKVFIPSACGGKATCGFCKVNVLSGGGPVLPTEIPFLSRGEMLSDTRLACQVKVKEDMEITIPEDLLAVQEFHAKVALVKDLTHDIKELNFDLIEPAAIQHSPGKYIQIQAPGPDGAVFRAYSISTPDYVEDKIQLIVRIVPGGIASTYLHNLKEGDEVYFTGPYGEFKLDKNPEVAVLCIGGGSGMAPIQSLVTSIYSRTPDRECYLFFGCRTTKDVFYMEKFKKMAEQYPNFHVHYALSDPLEDDSSWDGETGFIHLSVDKLLPENLDLQTFLCGPPPMIAAVQEVLADKGYDPENAFYDKF